MTSTSHSLSYPRRSIARGFLHLVGRLLLPLFFKIECTGKEHFPEGGPLIVVGNHTAAMEALLITIYTPWQIELLSAADIPAEKITQWLSDLYGVIPLHRGSFDRSALRKALDVLEQKGVVGLFPEGGIWEEGKREAQSGVAWLSYRSKAPVLPIGFSNTTGTLNAALNLKRPTLKMNVGNVLAPAKLPENMPRREYLRSYATQVMDEVHKLVPEEDRVPEPDIVDERFELQVTILDQDQRPQTIPDDLRIQHPYALAKVLHRPAILKIFRVNLNMPVEPLQHLDQEPSAEELINALHPAIHYLHEENPYLLTYRFGPQEGCAMQEGLEELFALLKWVQDHEYAIQIVPIRTYYSREKGQEIVQTEQGDFTHWM
ncbi:MAG: lysophospholipid acyltransferase family protein [Anaerolineales bacterium]